MATLTTSYQMLAQKYLGNSYGNLYVRVYAKYTERDIANNRTKVQYEARAYFSGSYIYDASGAGKISGTSATSVSGSCTKPTEGETVIATTTAAWVTHGSNGKKSISASAYLNFPNWGWSGTATGTADLPAIPRQAVINSAQNFSDEGNPTITYTNSAGSSVSSLQAGISFDGTTFQVAYRDVSKTGTSYTFELTDAERTALRNACTTANSRTVYFYLKTVISGTTYTNKFSKTFSVVNASPTLSATAKDTNSTTTALTGDANKIIKGFNTVSVTATATALKGATIKSYKITNGSRSLTTSSGTFTNVESGTFVFSVIDSRGNTTTVTLIKTLINYVLLTANLSANMTVDGTITATVNGNYFNGSFGSVANTLTVQYRYKTVGGTYGSWTSATATKNGNTYTANISITGLDYKSKYIIQARAVDKLATIESRTITLNCLPVFDWGENDFNFGVPVNFGGGILNGNKVLWSGAYHMSASETATLSESISSQAYGIVLVFSRYASDAAQNYHWQCFFVPKDQVTAHSGNGRSFLLTSGGSFDVMSAKYLYISNSKITGNDVNTASGTGSGVTYNNSGYVLRYVVGV